MTIWCNNKGDKPVYMQVIHIGTTQNSIEHAFSTCISIVIILLIDILRGKENPTVYLGTPGTYRSASIHWKLYRHRSSVMTKVTVFIDDPSKGHLRLLEINNSFLPITGDREEIEAWEWSHCDSLIKSHRLICNITYLGHHVTLNLTSNFDLDLSRWPCMFRCVLTRQKRWYQNIICIIKNNEDISENSLFNPRTAGGLRHLRTAGGGGHICAPPPANSKTTQRIDKRKKTLDRS